MYFLSSRGINYVRAFTLDKGRSRPPRINSAFSLVHVKNLNDFWLSLKLACRAYGVVLVGFVPEFAPGLDRGQKATCLEVVNPRANQKFHLIPDAVFAIEGSQSIRLFALEIDLSTGKIQSRTYKSFISQVIKYIWCRQSGAFKAQAYEEYFGDRIKDFQALYVTTTTARIDRYRNALSALGDLMRFVQFTTFDQIAPDRILGEIWRSSNVNDKNLYSLID